MSSTLRASAAGLERVDHARRKRGWNKTEPAWCDQALTTVPTLKRFWLGKPIQQAAFQGICQVVGIEDWETIINDGSKDSSDDPSTESSQPALTLSTYDETTWVGRTALTQTLNAKLQRCRLLMLSGLTGIGKTALAERLAVDAITLRPSLRFCRFSFDDVQEQTFSTGSRWLLEDALRISLPKEDLNDADALLRRLVQTLKQQAYWLQLDSLEVLLVEAEQGGNRFADPTWLSFFRQFLSGGGSSYCVLTSQDVPGELKAVGSRYPKAWHCQSLQGLTPTEQLDLFRQQGIDPFSSSDTLDYLQRIGNVYEGHPLVLQVIAGEILTEFRGKVPSYWQRYRAELEQIDHQSTLVQAQGNISPGVRSQDLKHIARNRVQQSLERLPETVRHLFCESSVYRRPVPVAFWLAMASGLSDAQQQAAFDTLQDRYLVEWEGNLIRAHNLTRSVAYDLLREDRDRWQAAERTAAHCWQNYQPDFNAPNLEQVRGSLEAFHHYCEAEGWEEASEILFGGSNHSTEYALHKQLAVWGYYSDVLQLHRKLLHHLKPQTDMRCLLGLGVNHYSLCQYDLAIEYLQRGLVLARELSDRQQERALSNLSNVYLRLSNFTKVVETLQQSLGIAQDINDQLLEGTVLTNLANVYVALGNYVQAIDYCQRSLAIAREVGDRLAEGHGLGNLGLAYAYLGDCAMALECQQQSLALRQAVGDQYGEALALANLGHVHLLLSSYEQSIQHCQAALVIAQSIGDRFIEASVLVNLGAVCHSLGDYAEATGYQQQALSLFRDIGDRQGEGNALDGLGDVCCSLGSYTQAIDYHQQALTLFQEIGNRVGEAVALGNLGAAYTAIGKVGKAIALNQQALTISREIGNRQNEAVVLGNLGAAYAALDDAAQAIDLYQQQLTCSREIGHRRVETQALLNLGKMQLQMEHYPEADAFLQAALLICQNIGSPTQADALKCLAELHYRQNLLEQAHQFEQQAAAIAALDLSVAEAGSNNRRSSKKAC